MDYFKGDGLGVMPHQLSGGPGRNQGCNGLKVPDLMLYEWVLPKHIEFVLDRGVGNKMIQKKDMQFLLALPVASVSRPVVSPKK